MFLDKYWRFDPSQITKKVGRKFSPMAQLVFQTFTDATASGFKNINTNDKAGWDRFWGLVQTYAEAPMPFSSRQTYLMFKDFVLGKKRDPGKKFNPLSLALPISK